VYTITYRPELKLLDIAWHGVFRPEAVADYAQAVWDRFRQEGLTPGDYKLRMDMSESAVQTQEALGVFREVFKGFPRASRIAIITPSAIAKLQVRREMTQPYLRMFETAEESLAWLAEADAAAE
jgi:hypothetical protein